MKAHAPYKLLIVDDDEETLFNMHAFFKKKKYSVVSAPGGLEGLKAFDEENGGFDIVITDLVMPNISGVGLIRILKKKKPEIPVIAITGWGEHPESLASEAMADLILAKPIDLLEIEQHILELCKKR